MAFTYVSKFGQTGSDDRRAEDDVRDGGDGSQIAYQVLGDGPLDLVFLTGSLSHVDVRWEHPPSARARERMASFSRFICFDRRGVGASDRLPDDAIPTWQEWSDDLGVVLDAVGSESAAICGTADGGQMALTFVRGLRGPVALRSARPLR